MNYSVSNEWGTWVIYWSRRHSLGVRAVNGRRVTNREKALEFAERHGVAYFLKLEGNEAKRVPIESA